MANSKPIQRRLNIRGLTLSSILSALIIMMIWLNRIMPTAHMSIYTLMTIFMMIIVHECGMFWAVLSYLVCAIIAGIWVGIPSAWAFIAFFGVWPIFKGYVESHITLKSKRNWIISTAIKAVVALILVLLVSWIFAGLLAGAISALQMRLGLSYIFILSLFWLKVMLYDVFLTFFFSYVFVRFRHMFTQNYYKH